MSPLPGPEEGGGAQEVSGAVEARGREPGRLEREELYTGRIVKLSLDRVRFPGGQTGELEHIRHPGASAVLPFLDAPTDPDPRVGLIRQYRYSAGGYLWEVPAGMPDSPHEAWEDCARRELAEETGYRVGELRYMTRIFTTPGFTDEQIHLFAAAELEAGETRRDSDEFLSVEVLPFSQAVEGVRRGQIVDCKSVAAILYADRFLTRAWADHRPAPPR